MVVISYVLGDDCSAMNEFTSISNMSNDILKALEMPGVSCVYYGKMIGQDVVWLEWPEENTEIATCNGAIILKLIYL